MDLMNMGISLLTEQFSGEVSEDQASDALSGLLGDGDGGIDFSSLVERFTSSGGLGDIVGSWLGDEENSSIDPAQLLEMFGGDKLSEFSDTLGIDHDSAVQGLSDMLPQLIDGGSEGGSMLDSVGGLEGVFAFVKKLF